ERYYDAAKAVFQDSANAYSAHGTNYARLLAGMAIRLAELLTEKFASNRAVQPADVTAGPVEKKYPLHLVARPIDLDLIVTNRGPGYAYDTQLDIHLLTEREDQNQYHFELGRLSPGVNQLVEVPLRLKKPTSSLRLICRLAWR